MPAGIIVLLFQFDQELRNTLHLHKVLLQDYLGGIASDIKIFFSRYTFRHPFSFIKHYIYAVNNKVYKIYFYIESLTIL